MEDVDDVGPNVELDEIDVELDDGTALILGEELIDGVRVGDIVTVGPTLPTSMTLLEGGFDDVVGPMLLPLVEGTLSDDKGDININGLLLLMLAGRMEYVGPTLKMTPLAEVGVIERVGPPLLPAMPPPNDEDGDGSPVSVRSNTSAH